MFVDLGKLNVDDTNVNICNVQDYKVNLINKTNVFYKKKNIRIYCYRHF